MMIQMQVTPEEARYQPVYVYIEDELARMLAAK